MNVDRKGIGLSISSSSFFESLNFVDGFKGENQEVGLVFTDTISGRTFFSNSSVFPELPVFELHSSIDRWSFHFTLPRKSSIFPTGWASRLPFDSRLSFVRLREIEQVTHFSGAWLETRKSFDFVQCLEFDSWLVLSINQQSSALGGIWAFASVGGFSFNLLIQFGYCFSLIYLIENSSCLLKIAGPRFDWFDSCFYLEYLLKVRIELPKLRW